MCGSFVRGTTPSCVQRLDAIRPSAPNACLRHFHNNSRSASWSPAALRGACALAMASTRSARGPSRLQAIDLHDEHGPGVEREAEMERGLDGLQDDLVDHLERGRDDAAPTMSLMVLVV